MKLKRILWWSAGAISFALLAAAFIAYWTSGNACDGRSAPRGEMKAVVFCDYGAPDVLELQDAEKCVPDDDQVLIRVRAASVNPLDWHRMRGTPYVARVEMGLRKPKVIRLGVDFAGMVESVGRSVTAFKPGDAVFGDYVCVREDRAVALKPANLTFEQAAAVPVAAVTALQGLRDKGKLQPGEKVLINGSSGGVGTFAVQIAKALGADVTGVCSTRNVAMVRSIGADRVIDYTREDFTKSGQRYDLILDTVGNHSLSEGRYIMVGGPAGRWIDPLPRAFNAFLLSRFVSQDMRFFVAELNKQDLTVLSGLLETGKVTPVIDRRYVLSDVPAAVRYLEEGHARGKVVITVSTSSERP